MLFLVNLSLMLSFTSFKHFKHMGCTIQDCTLRTPHDRTPHAACRLAAIRSSMVLVSGALLADVVNMKHSLAICPSVDPIASNKYRLCRISAQATVRTSHLGGAGRHSANCD